MFKSKLVTFISIAFLSTAATAEESKTNNRIDTSERITVTWVNPKSFTDVKPTYGVQSKFNNRTFSELYQFMEILAQRLPEGQKLKFKVTDLDLAGRVIPGHFVGNRNSNDVRVVKKTQIPRMDFSFELIDSDGSVIKSGEKELHNLGFLSRINHVRRNDHLRHEKSMLKRWFKKEFEAELTTNTL